MNPKIPKELFRSDDSTTLSFSQSAWSIGLEGILVVNIYILSVGSISKLKKLPFVLFLLEVKVVLAAVIYVSRVSD